MGQGRVLRRLQREVRALAPAEGWWETGVPRMWACRFSGEEVQMPRIQLPYLYLVLDGALRLHTPSGILDYGAGQYSISRIDTPLRGTVLAPSREGDLLALALAFAANQVIEVVLALDRELTERIAGEGLGEGTAAAADRAAFQTADRLLATRDQPLPPAFLQDNLLRELLYNLLCGSCGRQFLQSIAEIGEAEEIYRANSWIKEHFRSSFTVEALAEQRNMSVSQFHQKFKSAVGMGLLQCQKRLRLTEARRLMLDEGRNVTEAALEVGYESVSQFIRDYRRIFGAAPGEDIRRLWRQLKK